MKQMFFKHKDAFSDIKGGELDFKELISAQKKHSFLLTCSYFTRACVFYSNSLSLLWKLPSGSEAIYGTSEHVLNGTIMRPSVPQ